VAPISDGYTNGSRVDLTAGRSASDCTGGHPPGAADRALLSNVGRGEHRHFEWRQIVVMPLQLTEA